jgi:hypothetical protein
MKLSDRQRKFMQLLTQLLQFIHENGYGVTIGDGYRDSRVFGMVGTMKGYGSPNSNHKLRLAIDLNLFKKTPNGWEYCVATEDHRECGEFWESIGGSWGGRWGDGNHYSLEWKGRK